MRARCSIRPSPPHGREQDKIGQLTGMGRARVLHGQEQALAIDDLADTDQLRQRNRGLVVRIYDMRIEPVSA